MATRSLGPKICRADIVSVAETREGNDKVAQAGMCSVIPVLVCIRQLGDNNNKHIIFLFSEVATPA